eukprot:TRINITY_DN14994_c1_g1_i8.p1 TRINITY_DN14994_c1_g1~~TRINITY_DN14994_c1_g1_i8.p1  ORF type:complete len:432 (-),score=90.08 TRINITY_DN14994_c1_g1_i8:304-1599(-)
MSTSSPVEQQPSSGERPSCQGLCGSKFLSSNCPPSAGTLKSNVLVHRDGLGDSPSLECAAVVVDVKCSDLEDSLAHGPAVASSRVPAEEAPEGIFVEQMCDADDNHGVQDLGADLISGPADKADKEPTCSSKATCSTSATVCPVVAPPAHCDDTHGAFVADSQHQTCLSEGPTAWLMVFTSFSICFVVIGTQWASGVLFSLIIDEFQESRGSTAAASALLHGSMLFPNTFQGMLQKRLSPKIICAAGAVVASTGFFCSALAQKLWHLYPTFALVGLGGGLAFPVSFGIVGAWFDKRRALASTLATTGSAMGSLVFGMCLRPFAAQFGVRTAFAALGVVELIIVGSASLVLRRPEPVKAIPQSSAAAVQSAGSSSGSSSSISCSSSSCSSNSRRSNDSSSNSSFNSSISSNSSNSSSSGNSSSSSRRRTRRP